MKGQRVGYVRVSSADQNAERQLDGISLDRVFTDKLSGKSTDRPQLNEMRAYVRSGDTVIVHSLDRLARNLQDLLTIVEGFTDKGVRVEFSKENLTFNGEDSAMSMLLLSMLGAVAEFERSLILERQREGIALAKKKGVYTGRVRSLSPIQAAELRQHAASGESKAGLARAYGISRETVYQYLRS